MLTCFLCQVCVAIGIATTIASVPRERRNERMHVRVPRLTRENGNVSMDLIDPPKQ